MQKVLILTYYWPPAGGPGVQRWLYFVKYLREFGIEPIVFIPENPQYPIIDQQLQQSIPEGVRVYRHKIWEPFRLAGILGKNKTRKMRSGILNRDNPSLADKILLWIRGNLFIPDARKFWVGSALKVLPAIIRKEGIKTLITTGPPHSVHLIGLKLREQENLRWMADFRDPWTTIGYHKALRLTKWARRKHLKLEREVLNGADRIITTSETTKIEFEGLTKKPISVVTNGFDSIPAGRDQPKGPFTVAHIGSLLSGRNPLALWEGLEELLGEDEGFRKDFQLELIGLVSEQTLGDIESCGLKPFMKLREYIPHKQAKEAQRSAQVLLLIEIDAPETRGIIPAKLFEYMAASRPILAIGPTGWEAGKLVEHSKCGAFFRYSEKEKIKSQLLKWYLAYRKGGLEIPAKGVEKYQRRALTEELAKILLWE
jgi:hypothetical protein